MKKILFVLFMLANSGLSYSATPKQIIVENEKSINFNFDGYSTQKGTKVFVLDSMNIDQRISFEIKASGISPGATGRMYKPRTSTDFDIKIQDAAGVSIQTYSGAKVRDLLCPVEVTITKWSSMPYSSELSGSILVY